MRWEVRLTHASPHMPVDCASTNNYPGHFIYPGMRLWLKSAQRNRLVGPCLLYSRVPVPCHQGIEWRTCTPYRCPVDVGQTGLKAILQKHSLKVHKEGFLGPHCNQCGCAPVCGKTPIIARHARVNTSIVTHAAAIAKANFLVNHRSP